MTNRYLRTEKEHSKSRGKLVQQLQDRFGARKQEKYILVSRLDNIFARKLISGLGRL